MNERWVSLISVKLGFHGEGSVQSGQVVLLGQLRFFLWSLLPLIKEFRKGLRRKAKDNFIST